jgi:hypothetical protein
VVPELSVCTDAGFVGRDHILGMEKSHDVGKHLGIITPRRDYPRLFLINTWAFDCLEWCCSQESRLLLFTNEYLTRVQGNCGADHLWAGEIFQGEHGAVADVKHGGEEGYGMAAVRHGHRLFNLEAEAVDAPWRFKQAQRAARSGQMTVQYLSLTKRPWSKAWACSRFSGRM